MRLPPFARSAAPLQASSRHKSTTSGRPSPSSPPTPSCSAFRVDARLPASPLSLPLLRAINAGLAPNTLHVVMPERFSISLRAAAF